MPDRNSDVDNPERLEALIRVAMWQRAKINPDGFDPNATRKERAQARADLYDEIETLWKRLDVSLLLAEIERISTDEACEGA